LARIKKQSDSAVMSRSPPYFRSHRRTSILGLSPNFIT